jgi:hypothetical protein
VPAFPRSCTNSEIMCASGDQCIKTESQCDGISDCKDKSDESTCTQRMYLL